MPFESFDQNSNVHYSNSLMHKAWCHNQKIQAGGTKSKFFCFKSSAHMYVFEEEAELICSGFWIKTHWHLNEKCGAFSNIVKLIGGISNNVTVINIYSFTRE